MRRPSARQVESGLHSPDSQQDRDKRGPSTPPAGCFVKVAEPLPPGLHLQFPVPRSDPSLRAPFP